MRHDVVRTGFVVTVLLSTWGGSAQTQGAAPSLYSCAAQPHDEAEVLGLTLCDAEPTAELAARAVSDNLQQREGALVSELEADGVSDEAGMRAGDMIYCVGGVDVSDAETAAESLAHVRSHSDTVVNVLRHGRPYRIKLRRE